MAVGMHPTEHRYFMLYTVKHLFALGTVELNCFILCIAKQSIESNIIHSSDKTLSEKLTAIFSPQNCTVEKIQSTSESSLKHFAPLKEQQAF